MTFQCAEGPIFVQDKSGDRLVADQRDRGTRRADKNKINAVLVALGCRPSGRGFHKRIQEQLGDDEISRSSAYNIYNGEPSEKWKEVERALGVRFETIELHEVQFKSQWQHLHEEFYVGPVWIQLQPGPANRNKDHSLMIRWGEWTFHNILRLDGELSLSHMKRDRESHWIHLEIDPPCSCDFGSGNPPKPFLDINTGWADEEGILAPLVQFLILAILVGLNPVDLLIGRANHRDAR